MPGRLVIHRRPGARHSSIWLKGVEAVNLAEHCIGSLIGVRFPLEADADLQAVDLTVECPAYYLCAVSKPYRWDRNAHLLLLPEPEHPPVTRTVPGLIVEIYGLRPVTVRQEWIREPGRYRGDPKFTTCRNLQAAHWMHDRLGLVDRIGHDRYAPKTRRTPRR